MNEQDAIARIKRLSANINCADEIVDLIERLIKERDEAINKYNELVKSPVLAFVKNKWLSNATSIEMVFTHEFMRECPDVLVEQIASDIKHAMMTEMNKSSTTAEWTPVRFGSALKKTMDKYEPIMKKISELDGEK
jgi:hypothetical protein